MSRVVPGIVMAVAWLLLLFFGSVFLFWSVLMVGTLLALYEYFSMTQPTLGTVERLLTIGCTSLPVVAALFGTTDAVLAGLVASLISLAVIVIRSYGKLENSFTYFSISCFAVVYLSVTISHLALIRTLPEGAYWLIILTAMTAGSDTGAYYAGKRFGRRKLCPVISPKKTIAGGVGGLLAGVLAAGIFSLLLPVTTNLLPLIFLTGLLIFIGIGGDLTESVIKRSVGVKDSGRMLAGHGGLLDRIDSLLLTAPVLYYLLRYGVL